MKRHYNSTVSFQTVLETTITVEGGKITNTRYYMRSPAGKRVEVVPYLYESESTVDAVIEDVVRARGVKLKATDNE